MRKGLIGIVVLLVALVLLVPFGMGYWVKDYYPKLLKVAETESNAQIKLVSYKRGWFSSQAVVSVNVNNPNGWAIGAQPTAAPINTNKNLTFVVQQEIKHGPLMWINNKLAVGRAYIHTQLVKPAIPVSHNTIIRLNGVRDTRIQIPSLVFQNPQGQAIIVLNGLDFNAKAASDQKAITGGFTVNDFVIKNPEGSHHAQFIKYAFQINKNVEGLWLGTHSVQMPKLVLTSAAGSPQTIVSGSDIQLNVIENNNRLTYDANYTINNVTVGDKSYGPNKIVVSVKDIDADALGQIKQQLQSLAHVSNPSPSQVFSFYPLVMNLLNKGMAIKIQKLDLNTAWGKVFLQADIKLPQQSKPTFNIGQVVKNLDINLNLKAPASLVQYVVEQYKQGKNQEAQQPLAAIPSPIGEEATAAQATAQAATHAPITLSPAEEAQRQIAYWVKSGELIPEGEASQPTIMTPETTAPATTNQPNAVTPAAPPSIANPATTSTPNAPAPVVAPAAGTLVPEAAPAAPNAPVPQPASPLNGEPGSINPAPTPGAPSVTEPKLPMIEHNHETMNQIGNDQNNNNAKAEIPNAMSPITSP
jgi:uncharacterized protein YdgA (DUF945 family)